MRVSYNQTFRYAIALFISGFTLTVCFSSCRSDEEKRSLELKRMFVKGKIIRVVQNHELFFYIDNVEGKFPMRFDFDKDSYREINEISKNEKYMLPAVGDSVFKQANSRFVKFKRRDKIFIEHIDAY